MFTWWDSLSLASQIFAGIAIPTTVLLLIQTVLMFVGIGTDADGVDELPLSDSAADTALDDPDPTGMDSFHIFTIRGIIAFFVVFGWLGLVMDSAAISLWITIPVAALAGFAMMLLLAFLLKAVMKLRSGGNMENKNALGTAGTVYLTIPPARSGTGKVNVLLQGSYIERDAVTDDDSAIPTGAEIVVTGISGQTTLVVKRK